MRVSTMNAMNYGQVLTEIASVCQTLRAFIRMGLVNRSRCRGDTRRLQQKPGMETEPSVPMPGFILKYCGSWITLSTLKPTEMLYQSTSVTDEWNTWGSWVNSTPPSYFSAIISMLRRPRPLWLGLLETYRPSTFLISS